MRKKPTHEFHLHIPPDIGTFYRMVAKQQRVPMSKVLRDALEAAMQEKDIPNPVMLARFDTLDAEVKATLHGIKTLRDAIAKALAQSQEKTIAAAVDVATTQGRTAMQHLLEAMLTAAKEEGKGVLGRVGEKVWKALHEPAPREAQQ